MININLQSVSQLNKQSINPACPYHPICKGLYYKDHGTAKMPKHNRISTQVYYNKAKYSSYSIINNYQKPAEPLCSANNTSEVIKMYNVSSTTLLRNIPKPFLPFICFAVFFFSWQDTFKRIHLNI